MKLVAKCLFVVGLLCLALAVGCGPPSVAARLRQAPVAKGKIISVVNATGTVQPLKRVPVGSLFSGQVVKVHVKHNDSVTQGQVLAEIDSMASSGYMKITSPIDGVVIDRQVEEGQTLGDRMTPNLFVVTPDLRKEIHVYAAVDEADIRLIREAQEHNQPVHFSVDAYPQDLFQGRIQQVRMNPIIRENVVTYQVVVTAANPDLKLLPGMTAKVSFQIEQRDDALKIPNSALRFYPKPQYVCAADLHLVEGKAEDGGAATENATD